MVIFLSVVLGLCSIVSLYPVHRYKVNIFIYLFVGFLLMLAASFREGWADYETYIDYYNGIVAGQEIIVEISYVWISKLVYILYDDIILLFIIYAVLGVSLKLVAISKLSEFWFLSLIFYISYYFIVQDLIQIRAAVATGFLLLCIIPMYTRKLIPFIFFFLCAFLFHYSAIAILPLWFLSKTKCNTFFWACLIPASYVVFLLGINVVIGLIPIPAIQEKILVYQSLQELGKHNDINVFNIKYLLKVVLFYLFLWKSDLLIQHNKYTHLLIKIYGISLFVFPLFASLPILSYRLNELYGIVEIILFPLLILIAKPRGIAKPIVIVLGISFFLMYVHLISYSRI